MFSIRPTSGVEPGSPILKRDSRKWYHQALVRCSQSSQKIHLRPSLPSRPLHYLSPSHPSPSLSTDLYLCHNVAHAMWYTRLLNNCSSSLESRLSRYFCDFRYYTVYP